VTQPYDDLIARLFYDEFPYFTGLLQGAFLAYLAVGLLLLLLGWRPLRRRLGRSLFAPYLLAGQVALILAWPVLASLVLSAGAAFWADVVVTAHFALVVAVLAGLLLVLIGWPLGWKWTRNFWFRMAHLVVIEIVALQGIVHVECPLTTLERELRGGAGHLHDLDNASAVGRFCNEALFLFPVSREPIKLACYVVFGGLVVLAWVVIPPRLPWRPPEAEPSWHRLPACEQPQAGSLCYGSSTTLMQPSFLSRKVR
jgi:hypothetical protein